jgi:hypothetical protein
MMMIITCKIKKEVKDLVDQVQEDHHLDLHQEIEIIPITQIMVKWVVKDRDQDQDQDRDQDQIQEVNLDQVQEVSQIDREIIKAKIPILKKEVMVFQDKESEDNLAMNIEEI